MSLLENFKLFAKSFNPWAYKFLADRFLDNAFRYLAFLFIFSFLAMIVLFLPILLTIQGDVQEKANQIDDFYLEAHVTLTKPVTLMEDPLIVLDFNRTYPVKEKILITNQSLFYNKYYFFGDKQLVFSDIKNLRSPEASNVLAFLAALIIPTLLLLLLIFFVIKDLAFIFAVSLIGYVIANLCKQQVGYSKSLRVAIFAATPMIFLEFALLPFWRMFWLPALLFLAYYVFGITQIGEKKYEYRRGPF